MMIDNREHIETLLFDKIAGTISEQDNLVVENAILNHVEIRTMWEELLLKMNTPKAAGFLSGIDTEYAWQKTNYRLNTQKRSPFKSRKWQLSGIAAVLALVLPLIAYFYYQQRKLKMETKIYASKQIHLETDDGNLVEIAPGRQVSIGQTKIVTTEKQLSYKTGAEVQGRWATLVVPAAKDYKIVLSDGTQVWMNAQSGLRFPFQFSSGKREVYLTGEAYFEVAKNPHQEFVVHTDHADIHVHGTSFNVNTYNAGNFTVALVEGSVTATTNGQQVDLKPGQKAVLASSRLQMALYDAQEELGWMKGTYLFHNQRLAEIAQVISRWFDIKVAWETNAVAEQTFTGEIDRNLPLAVVLSNLQLSSGIKATIKNGVLTFK